MAKNLFQLNQRS